MFRVKHERQLKKAVDLGRTYLRLEGLSEGEIHEETLEIGEGGYGQLRVAVRIDILEGWRPTPSLVQSSVLNWVFPSLTSLPTRRLRNFRVFLNRTEFAPGDVIRGTIVLAAARPTSLVLRLYGRQICRVILNRTTSAKNMRWPHQSTYSFFDTSIQLLNETDLSLGMKVFPFEFQLPSYLPSTGKYHAHDAVSLGLQWDGHSSVEYGLEVIAKEPGGAVRSFAPHIVVKSNYAPSPRILTALSKLGPNPRNIKPFYPIFGKKKRKQKELEVPNSEIRVSLDAPLSVRLDEELNLQVFMKNLSPQTTVYSITVFLDQYNWFISHNARWVPFVKKNTVQTWRLTPENCKMDSTVLPCPPGSDFQAVLRAHLSPDLPPTLPEQISPLCHIVYFFRVVVETGPVAGEVVLRFDIPVYIAPRSDDSFSNNNTEEQPLLNGFWPCNPCFLPTFHRQWGEPSAEEYSERPTSVNDRRITKQNNQLPRYASPTQGRTALISSASAINVSPRSTLYDLTATSNTISSSTTTHLPQTSITSPSYPTDGVKDSPAHSSPTSSQAKRPLAMSLRGSQPRPRRGRESNVSMSDLDFINLAFRAPDQAPNASSDSRRGSVSQPSSPRENTAQPSTSGYAMVLAPPPQEAVQQRLPTPPASPTPLEALTEDEEVHHSSTPSPIAEITSPSSSSSVAPPSSFKPPGSTRRPFPVPPPRSQKALAAGTEPLVSSSKIGDLSPGSVRSPTPTSIRSPTPTRLRTRDPSPTPLPSNYSPIEASISSTSANATPTADPTSAGPLLEAQTSNSPSPSAPPKSPSPSLLDHQQHENASQLSDDPNTRPLSPPPSSKLALFERSSPTKPAAVPRPPDSSYHDLLLKSFYGLATEKPRIEVVEKYSKALRTGGRYLFAPVLLAIVPDNLAWRFIFPDPKLFDLYTEAPLRGWKRAVIGDTHMILGRDEFARLPKHNWTDDACEGGILYNSKNQKVEFSQLDHFTPSRDTVFEVATAIGSVDLDLHPDPHREILELDTDELEIGGSYDEIPALLSESSAPSETAVVNVSEPVAQPDL